MSFLTPGSRSSAAWLFFAPGLPFRYLKQQKKSDPRRQTKIHEGPPSVTALPHRQGCGPASRRVPPRAARAMGGGPPGSAGVSPACIPVAYRSVPCNTAPGHPAGGNGMGWAEAESRGRCRSSRVEEMAKAVPGPVRAGRPRSRVASSHNVVAPKEVHRYSCLFVFIQERGKSHRLTDCRLVPRLLYFH